jgi:hypothetical protein
VDVDYVCVAEDPLISQFSDTHIILAAVSWSAVVKQVV